MPLFAGPFWRPVGAQSASQPWHTEPLTPMGRAFIDLCGVLQAIPSKVPLFSVTLCSSSVGSPMQNPKSFLDILRYWLMICSHGCTQVAYP